MPEVSDALRAGADQDCELREVLVELDAELAQQRRTLADRRRRRLAELPGRPGEVAASEDVVQLPAAAAADDGEGRPVRGACDGRRRRPAGGRARRGPGGEQPAVAGGRAQDDASKPAWQAFLVTLASAQRRCMLLGWARRQGLLDLDGA